MNKINVEQIALQLRDAERAFSGTKYQNILEEAVNNFPDLKKVQESLNKLPTDAKLLKELVQKLKGKSVYKNLERLNKGGTGLNELKTASSLLTHVCIEIDSRNKEFRKLIPLLLEKINSISYKIYY
jgi:hypothetical protein